MLARCSRGDERSFSIENSVMCVLVNPRYCPGFITVILFALPGFDLGVARNPNESCRIMKLAGHFPAFFKILGWKRVRR
jgi:hypothetical protein